MKKYETPKADMLYFDVESIITASGDTQAVTAADVAAANSASVQGTDGTFFFTF